MAKKPKLNIPLLKRLKGRFMRMRHPKHFDMSIVAEKNECGTAMCIAGHILNLQGYKWSFDEEGNLYRIVSPAGRNVRNELRVAARAIGLPYAQWLTGTPDAYNLFNDMSIKTPKEAAGRIQEIIEGGTNGG